MVNITLPLLPDNLAFWRITKLPVAEIRQCLEVAELQTTGRKSQLAKQLHEHPQRHRCSRCHTRSSASGNDDRRCPSLRHGRSQTHGHSHCLADDSHHHCQCCRLRPSSQETPHESQSRSYTTSTSASLISSSSSDHTGHSSSSSYSRAMSPSP